MKIKNFRISNHNNKNIKKGMKLVNDAVFLALWKACENFQALYFTPGIDITSMVLGMCKMFSGDSTMIDTIPTKDIILKQKYPIDNIKEIDYLINLGACIHWIAHKLEGMKYIHTFFIDNIIYLAPGDWSFVPTSKMQLPSLGQMRILFVGKIMIECIRQNAEKTDILRSFYSSPDNIGFYMFMTDVKNFLSHPRCISDIDSAFSEMNNTPMTQIDMIQKIDHFSNTTFMHIFTLIGRVCTACNTFEPKDYGSFISVLKYKVGDWAYIYHRSCNQVSEEVTKEEMDTIMEGFDIRIHIGHLINTVEWLKSNSRENPPDGGRLECIATNVMFHLMNIKKYC